MRCPTLATVRHAASSAATAMPSGIASATEIVEVPPCGRATARNQPSPPAQHATPISITRSGLWCRNRAPKYTAKIRSQTIIGWTSASGPKRSATIWKTTPTMFRAIASSHSGRRSSAKMSPTDTALRCTATCLVLRSSRTAVMPSVAEAPSAPPTAITGNIAGRYPRWSGCSTR